AVEQAEQADLGAVDAQLAHDLPGELATERIAGDRIRAARANAAQFLDHARGDARQAGVAQLLDREGADIEHIERLLGPERAGERFEHDDRAAVAGEEHERRALAAGLDGDHAAQGAGRIAAQLVDQAREAAHRRRLEEARGAYPHAELLL